MLDGAYFQARFVLDPATGRPVMPMPPEWDPRDAGSDELGRVLYLPDDSEPVLQLVVEPAPIDPRTHEGVDRWAAYHGSARERAWASLKVESARWDGEVCDGEDVTVGNPLRSAESRLLRDLNADRARLARLCAKGTGFAPEAPMAVGVDPDGVDVRASLGVVRVEFPTPCPDEGAARLAIGALADGG